MRELGILTGSSLSALLSWEKGKFRPSGEKKAAPVALGKVRKRGVRKLLVEKEEAKEKERKPEIKARKKKPDKRVNRRRK
jgi:hypothetical protein